MDIMIIFAAKYLYILIILIALVYVFLQPKNLKKEIAILAIISFPVIYLVAKIAGHFYFDPRPFVVQHIVPLIPHSADNGFPSDHTLLSAAVASVIYFYNKRVSLVLLVLALAVGFSRVGAKIHHPIDIVGSIVIAILVTSIVYFILRSKKLDNVKAKFGLV